MCAVKTPKIKQPKDSEQKPLPVIRNPLLDGILGNIASLRNGRNSLRINLLNPLAIPVGGGVGGGGGGTSGGGLGSGGGGGSLSGGTSGTSSGGSTGAARETSTRSRDDGTDIR